MTRVVRTATEYDIRGQDVPRDLFPTGRVRIAYGVRPSQDRRGAERRRRRERLEDLRRWGAWDILCAITQGRIHVAEVCRRVQQGGEAAVAEIRADLERGKAGEIPTLAAEIERYLEWYARRRRVRSLIQVRSRLKRFTEQQVPGPDGPIVVGAIRLDRLTAAQVEQALDAGWPDPSSREAIRLAVSGLYHWSIREETERARADRRPPRWDTNPAAKVERTERRRRVTTASEQQVIRLLAAAEIYQEAYLRAFLHLGLRLDELTHSRLHDDLDLRDWHWTIQERAPDPRCGCPQCREEGWRPKSKRSHRTILVPAEPAGLRAAIARYLELHPCEPGDFVFRNPRTGGPWSAGRLQADFEALCERAGVRYGRRVPGGITLHDLRHTCATELVRRGERESVIAALLGDTVQTVVETYVNLKPDDLAAAVSRGPAYEVRL